MIKGGSCRATTNGFRYYTSGIYEKQKECVLLQRECIKRYLQENHWLC